IYHFTKLLLDKKKADLIILDIRMPHLSGIGAGNAVRAIEKAFKVSPVPFLFFSAKQADDELKKLIEHTAPAYYLNKGATSNIDDLSKRLITSVLTILGK
ncbi:MAG: response regulator, partial [Proteobacteria bacterium]|nr:response regulator [Pseudomonadota bacterium]